MKPEGGGISHFPRGPPVVMATCSRRTHCPEGCGRGEALGPQSAPAARALLGSAGWWGQRPPCTLALCCP